MKVVITGGGTGGHIFPALAIARELKRRQIDVVYVGGTLGMETKLVPPTGIPFYQVRSGAVKNQSAGRIAKTLFQLGLGVLWSIRFLLKEKPAAVIGVGGYVSVPVVIASFLTRIPIFLQEQNASVGIANRFLGKLANKIFIGFEQAKVCFPKGRSIFTGNPLREAFTERALKPHDPKAQQLLILGGSQGAQAINNCIVALLPKILERFPEITILHQTGVKDLEMVKAAYENHKTRCVAVPFIEDMVSAYENASLVIARSGALTCSELIQVQRPAILVPFPRRGQNDQTANAYYLQSENTVRVVEQGPDFELRFWAVFSETFPEVRLRTMATGFSRLRRESGLVSIGDHVERELGAKRR
jgi:UDP-N-acetylglucosamine--N-acetylmuramyl-(pentapeptide) pyrophosphoryl-undecaprenol N-acetylglucosamine transferase